MHKWGDGLYVKAPIGLDLHQAQAKRVWYTVYQRHHGVGYVSKWQRDLEKRDEIKAASSELFIKLEITLSIYVHSFELRIAKHCMSLIIFLIVGDSVSTGYIGRGKFSYGQEPVIWEFTISLFVGSIINYFSNGTEV